MDPQKIDLVFLCPSYPPKKCGVGDYIFKLQQQFPQSATFTLWPNPQESAIQLPDPCSVNYFFGQLQQRAPQAKKISIQYTPGLYFTRPWNPKIHLASLLLALKRRGQLSVLTVHESNYPFGLNLRGLFFGSMHLVVFFFLAMLADQLIFCHEKAYHFWQKNFFWWKSKMTWIPVGATISPTVLKNNFDLRDTITLAHFGAKHPTQLIDVVLRSYVELCQKYPEKKFQLLFLGNGPEHLRQEIEQWVPEKWRAEIYPLGFLPAEKISETLVKVDALLLPFLDGISSRRSTAMNALAHGIPLVTNLSYSTEISIPWHELAWTCQQKEHFTQAIEILLQSTAEQRQTRSKVAEDYFQQKFSWASIAREYKKIFERDSK